MKHFKYDSHIFSVPNAVFFIAKDLNGVLHGFRDEPKFDGKVWLVKGEWKWHIGVYGLPQNYLILTLYKN